MLISEYYFCLCLFLLRESSVRKMILLHAWPIVTTFTHLTHDLTNFLSVIIWSRYRPISCSHRRSCIVSQSSHCCDHLSAFSTFMLLTPLPTHPPPSLCRFISFIIPSISPPVSGLHVGGGGGGYVAQGQHPSVSKFRILTNICYNKQSSLLNLRVFSTYDRHIIFIIIMK